MFFAADDSHDSRAFNRRGRKTITQRFRGRSCKLKQSRRCKRQPVTIRIAALKFALCLSLVLQSQFKKSEKFLSKVRIRSRSAMVITSGETRDSVEFVAFLLWYLFLIFCCVLPTCCAYRRRRMMARLQREEDEWENRFQLLGNLAGQHCVNDEEVRLERTKRITEALKATNFVSIGVICLLRVEMS